MAKVTSEEKRMMKAGFRAIFNVLEVLEEKPEAEDFEELVMGIQVFITEENVFMNAAIILKETYFKLEPRYEVKKFEGKEVSICTHCHMIHKLSGLHNKYCRVHSHP